MSESSLPSPTLLICLVAAAIAVVGLFRGADSAPVASAPPAITGEALVTIEGFAFSSPAPVAGGTEVQVRNADGVPHTLTAVGGGFDTGSIGGNADAGVVAPTEPGTYEFFCEIHPSMHGSLVVE